MLFNSYGFLFCFLPITWTGAWLLNRWGSREVYIWWLVAASFLFYGWSDLSLLPLIGSSILGNFIVGRWLLDPNNRCRRTLLVLGILGNLGLIGYYKYTKLVVSTLLPILVEGTTIPEIALPLGISFFTFQQLAYLVDAYNGGAGHYRFRDYCLFVAFFPQLIAGPIVHHRELLEQFAPNRRLRLNERNVSLGLTLLIIGLTKKLMIADSLAPYASAVFAAAEKGRSMQGLEAWMGALAYTLQLYFDFSGYSDMALGLGRMFGVHLPFNFNSPYKAVDIIDFWRRWHITLSLFLRDYLYIPLGGGRCSPWRRHLNLMITMLLGGLWHGGSWTFVVWGGLHGLMLIVNHSWNSIRKRWESPGLIIPAWRFEVGRLVTFTCVVLAWVLFRAETFRGAGNMFSAMFGAHGFWSGRLNSLLAAHLRPAHCLEYLAVGLFIVRFLPNTQELLGRSRLVPGYRFVPDVKTWDGWLAQSLQWRPNRVMAIWYAALGCVAIGSLSQLSEFIYFNF